MLAQPIMRDALVRMCPRILPLGPDQGRLCPCPGHQLEKEVNP